MWKITLSYILLLFFTLSCKNEKQQTIRVQETKNIYPFGLDSFLSIKVGNHALDIAPATKASEYKGNIVILQGYNFPKTDCCEKIPELCSLARVQGYCLIMPEMGKSVYSSSFFPETRSDLKKYPQRTWFTDTLIIYLNQNYNLLTREQNNYILGISTGGRGAALIALDNSDIFSAVASLSGDFDQTKMPKDQIMISYYGNYENNEKRWQEVDNVLYRIKDWKLPIYLGHGAKDPVVPVQQSDIFYKALIQNIDSSIVVYNRPEMSHDYQYWKTESQAVLKFFSRHRKRQKQNKKI
jgi:esterase/lipase